jgi:hypothetical protein
LGKIPRLWKRADRCFLQKEKDAKTIGQFQIICLLTVEGKIYLSVLAKRLDYLVKSNYINTRGQESKASRVELSIPVYSHGL